MEQNEIELTDLIKKFQYEKLSREIDNCKDIEQIKEIAKSFIKMYLKQEEIIALVSREHGKTL